MLNYKLSKFKLMLVGLVLAGLLGGVFVGQAQQGQLIGAEHAIVIVARAATQFDILLLANRGIVSGTILNETFTISLEGGPTRTVAKEEIATLDLKGNGRLQDRIILRSQKGLHGEMLQGDLQVKDFQLRLASGEEITLPRAQVQGAIMQFPVEGLPIPDPREPGPMVKVFKYLLGSPLTPEVVNSLTKYDWLWLNNDGLLSGSSTNKVFRFQGGNQFQKKELSVILFARQNALVVLKTGEFVMVGALEGMIHLDPTWQGPTVALPSDIVRVVIFRVPSLGGGGPGGPGG